MGALGNIISNAASAAKDAVLGDDSSKSSAPCTTVEDFLAKFSDSSGKYANQLNTLTTFEVSFKFYPTDTSAPAESSDNTSKLGKALDAAVGSLKSSAMKAAKNAVNNLTGGLLASLNNDAKGVMDMHGSYEDKGKYSFMHYLAAANLLVGDENEWFGKAGQAPKPLELQLGYYVQDIVIP